MKATIIGGGLAGCEAALALAARDVDVTLVEMRPVVKTAAHQTDRLGELVCSNSFKSIELQNAHGLLKQELRDLGSQLLPCADEARVPGGAALAVDREVFSQLVDARVKAVEPDHRGARGSGRVARGWHRGDRSADERCLGDGDQHAPRHRRAGLLRRDRADRLARLARPQPALRAQSRWGKGDGDDYLNAPMDKAMYEAFIDALVAGDQFQGHAFDEVPYFEGCLPVEEMAKRGRETLRFGPMKPIGLHDPRTNREPYAVVQFRREDKAGQMWNLVGFQTRLRIPEQQKVFRTIPGMAEAEFLRYGSIHRNSYLNAPAALGPALQVKDGAALFFAGQLTGVEGYTESLGHRHACAGSTWRACCMARRRACRRRARCWAGCCATCARRSRRTSSR